MIQEHNSEDSSVIVRDVNRQAGNSDISVGEMLRLNKPEWHLLLLGCLASIAAGLIQPFFSYLLSEGLAVSDIQLAY